MQRARSAGSFSYDPEPERSFHQRRREQIDREQRVENMDPKQELAQLRLKVQRQQELLGQQQQQQRTLGDYVLPRHLGPTSGVVRPPVQARNFELKPSLINMV